MSTPYERGYQASQIAERVEELYESLLDVTRATR